MIGYTESEFVKMTVTFIKITMTGRYYVKFSLTRHTINLQMLSFTILIISIISRMIPMFCVKQSCTCGTLYRECTYRPIGVICVDYFLLPDQYTFCLAETQ